MYAWQEGRARAQALAIQVGIAPADNGGNHSSSDDNDDDNDGDDTWFKAPFSHPSNRFGGPGMYEPESSDDEPECNVDCQNEGDLTLELEVEEAGDGQLLAHGAGDVMTLLDQDLPYLDESEESDDTEKAGKMKRKMVPPIVTIPGAMKTIYKSTLVTSLNEDKNLSADRLGRVRQRSEYTKRAQNDVSCSGVSLHERLCLLES